MAIGDIIFVHGTSLIAKGIEFLDHGKFSHVCISVADDNSRILEAQGMTRSRIVPFYFDDYEIVPIGLSEEMKFEALKNAVELTYLEYGYWQDVGYAFKDIFGFKYPYLFYNPKKPICSGLVDVFLHRIGWLKEHEYIGDRTPNQLYSEVMNRLKG